MALLVNHMHSFDSLEDVLLQSQSQDLPDLINGWKVANVKDKIVVNGLALII